MNKETELYVASKAIVDNEFEMNISNEPKMIIFKKAKFNPATGGYEDFTRPNMAWKFREVDSRIVDLKINRQVGIGEEYVPILKFRSKFLSSTFRLIISGTIGNFVYSGVFDIVVSHARLPMISNTVSTRYGRITIRIDYDDSGNGYISVKRDSGAEGLAAMEIVVIPYNGTIEFFADIVPEQSNTLESTFSTAGGE